MVIQCAWCHRVKIGPLYLRLPWIRDLTHTWRLRLPGGPDLSVHTTHGVCPSCSAKVRELAKLRRPREIRYLNVTIGEATVSERAAKNCG